MASGNSVRLGEGSMLVKMQSTAFKCKPTLFQQVDLVVPITYGTACFVRIKIASQINYLSFWFGNSRGRMGKAQHRDARLVPCSRMKAVGFGDNCNSEYQLQINRSWILSRAMPSAGRAACPHPSRAVSTVGRRGVCPGRVGALALLPCQMPSPSLRPRLPYPLQRDRPSRPVPVCWGATWAEEEEEFWLFAAF